MFAAAVCCVRQYVDSGLTVAQRRCGGVDLDYHTIWCWLAGNNTHAALKLMRKLLKNPLPAEARLLATETELISSGWRGAADIFLVVVTPSKNVAHGLLRT